MAQLISTNLCGATLSGGTVYGASVWNNKDLFRLIKSPPEVVAGSVVAHKAK
jgi:hypothetical protein